MTIGEERDHFGYDPIHDTYEDEEEFSRLPIVVVFISTTLLLGAGFIFGIIEFIKYIKKIVYK